MDYPGAKEMRDEDKAAIQAIAECYPITGTNSKDTIVELRREVSSLKQEISELKKKLTLEAVRAQPNPIGKAEKIIHAVARLYNVSYRDILARGRGRAAYLPRSHAMWEIRQHTLLSLTDIGRIMGRDHTTILHGIQRHQERIDRGEI